MAFFQAVLGLRLRIAVIYSNLLHVIALVSLACDWIHGTDRFNWKSALSLASQNHSDSGLRRPREFDQTAA